MAKKKMKDVDGGLEGEKERVSVVFEVEDQALL